MLFLSQILQAEEKLSPNHYKIFEVENQFHLPFSFPLPKEKPRPVVLEVVGNETCIFNGYLTGVYQLNARITNRECVDVMGNKTITRVAGYGEIKYQKTHKRTQLLKKGYVFKIEVKKDI